MEDSCHVGDVAKARGHLRFQRGNLIGSSVVEEAFGYEGKVGKLAHGLIGHRLAPVSPRGLYVIVPHENTDEISPVANQHIESHASQLIALCYLEKVVPGGGGLLVWPGSHREIYPVMGSKLEYVRTDPFHKVFRKWKDLSPIQLHGDQGDVIIIHHRLIHAPSLNRANHLRLGFLCDYFRDDAKALSAQTPGDMWEDWPAISSLPKVLTERPSDFTLSPIPNTPFLPANLLGELPKSKSADASHLARWRKPGATWLTISDNPKITSSNKLDPRGSKIDAMGFKVFINGKEIASRSDHDFVSDIELEAENTVKITGIDRPLWVRVLKLKLPFSDSEIRYASHLSMGDNLLDIPFEGQIKRSATVTSKDRIFN